MWVWMLLILVLLVAGYLLAAMLMPERFCGRVND